MQDNKQCLNCSFYEPYYTKGLYGNFYKKDIGLCRKHFKTVVPNESCNKWCFELPYRNTRKEMAIRTIPEIMTKLAAIEEILKEELEREKTRNKNE